MKQMIRRTALITIALILEAIDKKITEKEQETIEATQKPLEQPIISSPTKYNTLRINTSHATKQALAARPYRIAYNPNTGIITSTTATSKYTPEQLQSMYKVNPYTNLDRR